MGRVVGWMQAPCGEQLTWASQLGLDLSLQALACSCRRPNHVCMRTAGTQCVDIAALPRRRALLDGVIRLSCRIDVQQDVRRVLGPVPPESHEAYR